jgi:hypothetical protein
MKQRKYHIELISGIILNATRVMIELKTSAYQNLKFPTDIYSIILTSLGLTFLTLSLFKIINNKSLNNYTTKTIPFVLTLKYIIDLILSSNAGTTIHDLLLSIFSVTYPMAILIIAIQALSNIRTSKFWIVLSSLIGLSWIIINIVETKNFLEYRQYGALYAEEPQSNLTFVGIMFIILLWTALKINKLKLLKMHNDW